jgi:predicted lipid-binding transport protein (Tim44 family)
MRSAFDKLISWTGLALAAVLLAVGGLAMWANTFIDNQVHDQLVMQDITMPSGDAISGLPKADQNALKEFAGSKLDTGPEAKAFADHYILVHMNESSDNQTYEEISGQYIQLSDADKATPDGVALGQLRQSLFMGNTLRGLLLYGYAFATIGTIAGIAAYVSFAGGFLVLLLVGLGFWHARRAGQTAERPIVAAALQPA